MNIVACVRRLTMNILLYLIVLISNYIWLHITIKYTCIFILPTMKQSSVLIFIAFEFFVEFSTTTTTRSLTACEQLRLSAENTTVDAYRPKCTLNGEYEPLQCHRRMFNKECWCVDQLGNEVTGTRMMQPHVPDCITGIWLYCRKNSSHLTSYMYAASYTSVCIG